MSVATIIGRLGDGLVLTASQQENGRNSELMEPQAKAKQLLKKLHYTSPPKGAFQVPPYTLQYMIEGDVVYVAITEKGVSQDRVFSYLQEVILNFTQQYDSVQVKQATRPYSLIEFDTTLQKIQRTMRGRQRVSGLNVVHKELREVQTVLQDNIDSVLERGASLTDLETRGSGLLALSQEYRKEAKHLNRRSFYAIAGFFSLAIGSLLVYFFVL